jgi:hypothetical protein
LKVAGAEHAEIFSPGAIDYVFRCTSGIPRAINNLCDNALLNGFAAGETMISRAMIQEVAETFDILPRIAKVEEREAPARIFPAASRAELWSAGNGNGGNGNDSRDLSSANSQSSVDEFSLISSENDTDIVVNEYVRSEPASIEELGAAFSRSGLGRGNNGQSL